MAYEDPLEWDRQVRVLSQFANQFQRALGHDPSAADPSGPFVGIPYVTTRAAFADIRALPESLPLRQPLLRWAYRLADARVNAEMERAGALTWRSQPITLDMAQPQRTTRAELLTKLLSDRPAHGLWWQFLRQHMDGLSEWVSLLWQRRDELAKRAGFDGVMQVTDPVATMTTHARRWLTATDALRTSEWPQEPRAYLDCALAHHASEGWPAHLRASAIAALLGTSAWFARPLLREPRWPRLIGPTSFVRALHVVGRELARAWAPATHPFVLVHDAGHQREHRLGWLLATLPLNVDWQQRNLGVSRDRARSQVRVLTHALLLTARNLCLKVLLKPAATESTNSLKLAFAEMAPLALGFELDPVFAGIIPRLDLECTEQLLGLWFGCSDHARLRLTFDQDWFRNPHAIENLLEGVSTAPSHLLDDHAIERHQANANSWLVECLQVN